MQIMLFVIMPMVSLFGGMTVASALEPVKKEEVRTMDAKTLPALKHAFKVELLNAGKSTQGAAI
jgi:hypothetical protein